MKQTEMTTLERAIDTLDRDDTWKVADDEFMEIAKTMAEFADQLLAEKDAEIGRLKNSELLLKAIFANTWIDGDLREMLKTNLHFLDCIEVAKEKFIPKEKQ